MTIFLVEMVAVLGRDWRVGGKHQTTVFKRLILKFNYLEEISTDTSKKSSKEEMEC